MPNMRKEAELKKQSQWQQHSFSDYFSLQQVRQTVATYSEVAINPLPSHLKEKSGSKSGGMAVRSPWGDAAPP